MTEDELLARTNMMQVDAQNGDLQHLPRITGQQKVYVAARVGGLSPTAASKQAGVSYHKAKQWEGSPDVQAWMEHYYEVHAVQVIPKVRFELEDAHAMYMEAFHTADSSMAKIRATESLVKLHGVERKREVKLPSASDIRNIKQLAEMSLAQLAHLADMQDAIDGDFENVDD